MYIYLASPYTHDDPAMMQERYELARACAAWMFRKKWMVFSPIVHCHPMAVAHDIPKDSEFWRGYSRAMLRGSYELAVLKLAGWKESKGIKEELEFAERVGRVISYIDCSGVSFVVSVDPEF